MKGGCGCGFSGRDAMMSPEDLLRKLSGVGFEEAEHEMCIGLLLNSRVSILCGDSVSRRSRSGINSAREHATVEKDASGNKLLLDIGLWLTQKMKVVASMDCGATKYKALLCPQPAWTESITDLFFPSTTTGAAWRQGMLLDFYQKNGKRRPESIMLTITFITFRVEKEVKSQEVRVASVTVVNYYFILGKHYDVIVISSDKVEGSGDWNSSEYQDTTVSKGKKVMNALSFYRMETDEISEQYIASLLQEHTTEKPNRHDLNAQDNTKQWKNCFFHKVTTSFYYGKDVAVKLSLEIDDMLRIRLRETRSNEEVFTSVAWIRDFNINESIYAELCQEFYSIYEFDEVCADDELQSKKIIKFRLGGRAHNLTLLEFSRRLGLCQAFKLEEEGFNVYFEGGLRSDDNFNSQDFWLSISREDNLGLSRSHTSTIRKPILRVIHKMITFGLCQRTTGYDKIQKNDLWLLSMFDARHQNGVLTEDVVRSLSAPIYCRDLDTTILRDLVDYDGKLIPEDPQPGVPRVGIPRPSRASMQYLYDRMGRLEIRQEEIERMDYRQSYHWDRYHGVFEHMAGVYSVPLQGAYNPPGYAQPQYDQYYHQYPPPPPPYQPPQQQEEDDDE
ncbi:hypothetical protein Tco_0652392 [Tanacetum coccineum]|uniref:Uncharacterized protein n=1 Tax=Tanacetum coccineum TaxID=301880 RepID=A0ABQ4WXR9_9ASTR